MFVKDVFRKNTDRSIILPSLQLRNCVRYWFLSIMITFYKACPESIQPGGMKNRDIYWRRYKIPETLYIGQDTLAPFRVGTLGPHTVLPNAISCPFYFPESHWWSETSSLSKVILVLGKARSRRVPNLGCRGLSYLGDLMFFQKLCISRGMSGCVTMMKLPITSCP